VYSSREPERKVIQGIRAEFKARSTRRGNVYAPGGKTGPWHLNLEEFSFRELRLPWFALAPGRLRSPGSEQR